MLMEIAKICLRVTVVMAVAITSLRSSLIDFWCVRSRCSCLSIPRHAKWSCIGISTFSKCLLLPLRYFHIFYIIGACYFGSTFATVVSFEFPRSMPSLSIVNNVQKYSHNQIIGRPIQNNEIGSYEHWNIENRKGQQKGNKCNEEEVHNRKNTWDTQHRR